MLYAGGCGSLTKRTKIAWSDVLVVVSNVSGPIYAVDCVSDRERRNIVKAR